MSNDQSSFEETADQAVVENEAINGENGIVFQQLDVNKLPYKPSPDEWKDIEDRFDFYPIHAEGEKLHQAMLVRKATADLARVIICAVPPGMDRITALAKLSAVMGFALRPIAVTVVGGEEVQPSVEGEDHE